jgi:hypothetical protein
MEESLKKILTSLLIEKYPKIRNFHVSGDEFGYSVGVYLKYDDMSVLTTQDIKDLKREIRDCAKYVFGAGESIRDRVRNVYFYEPQY